MSLIRINPQFNLFFPVSVLRGLGGCAQWGRSSLRCAPPVLLSLEKPGVVLQQQCQSRSSLWAEPAVSVSPGRAGEECSTWEQVLLSPLAHTDTCQTGVTPRSCSPGIIQTSLGFIPLPAAVVAAFIVLNSLTSQQGHLPDSAHFYISFASHILPHGCFTAL